MINVQKKHITTAQIGIFIWGLCIFAGVGLFFHFVEHPAASRALDVAAKVNFLESHLRWVSQTIERIQVPEKVFDHFVNKSRELDRKFPAEEQKSLAMIVDYANKFGVRIERIQAGEKRNVVDSRGKRFGADGKACYAVPLSMEFKSEYSNWIKYVETLRKVLPAFLVIQQTSIENSFSAKQPLEGKLQMTLYLLE